MRAAWTWLIVLALAACAEKKESALTPAAIEDRVLAGKLHLSRFEGREAREVFRALDADYRKEHGAPHCAAHMGVVLADIQVALSIVNPALVTLLEQQLRPATKSTPGSDAAIEAVAVAVEPTLRELAQYAEAVTAIPDCAFSIGLDEPKGEEDYRFIANVLDDAQPVVQVELRSRFDGVEARVVAGVVNAILAALDMALAHDLGWRVDAAKVAHQLGVTEACLAQGFVPCYFSGETADHPPAHLLDWAFVLEDNPALLGARSARWKERMPRVAGEGAAAVQPVRTLFDAMLARSERIYGSDVERETDYLLVYRDVDSNARVNTADQLGINIEAVRLDCTKLVGIVVAEREAEDCRRRFDDYQAIAQTALMFVRTAASPSERVVEELEVFFDRLHAQLYAVDAGGSAAPIPFNSLSGLFSEMVPLLEQEAPNFVAFDLGAFLRDPAPVRALLPAWKTTSGPTGARFVADADDYAALVTPPATLNAVDVYLDEAYGPYFGNLFGRAYPEVVDPLAVTERALFGCAAGEPCVPADCLNASNLYTDLPSLNPVADESSRFRWPVLYLWLPDPAFRGVVQVDGSVWGPVAGQGNGADAWGAFTCTSEPGFATPDNWSLQRSAWLFADFFLDNFAFAGMLSSVLPEQ